MRFRLGRNKVTLALSAIGSLGLVAGLSGCAMGTMNMSGDAPVSGTAFKISGNVHGGQQPVSGATIALYAAGTTGYGTGAQSLLTTTVTTNSSGVFTITGDYTCPAVTGGSQLYLVATGGNPGLPGTVNNYNLALMTALGTCPSGGTLSSALNVQINEYTTVAAVAALQQFMAAPASGNLRAPAIGAPSTSYGGFKTAQYGLQNAFSMFNNLADVSTGVAPSATSPVTLAGVTPESTKIGLIANILASCINSDPSSTTACSSLMTAATPQSATYTASDTIQAAYYMLQSANYFAPFYTNNSNSPTSVGTATASNTSFQTYVTNLVNLASAFQVYPALTTAKDFTIGVAIAPTATAGGYAIQGATVGPYLAADQFGNIWAMNYTSGVVELSPSGAVIMQPVTTYTAATAGGAYSQFTTAPTSNTRTFTNARGMLAIDTAGRAWVPNFGDSAGTPAAGSIAVFVPSSGLGVGSSGPSTGYYTGIAPFGVAIDASNDVFVTQTGSTGIDPKSLGEFTAAGGTYTYSNSTNTGINYGIAAGTSGSAYPAVDANSNNGPYVWVVENQGCKAAIPYGDLGQFTVSALAPTAQSAYATANGYNTTNCTTTNGVNASIAAATANMFGATVDRFNNIWTLDEYTSSTGFDGATYFLQNTALNTTASSSTGLIGSTSAASATYVDNGAASGTNIKKPFFSAIDGNNILWGINDGMGSVFTASYAGAGTGVVLDSPAGGYAKSTIGNGTGIAIDPSGNVWTSSYSAATYTNAAGGTTPEANALTVIVGAAGPVITPLSLALNQNKVGQKP